MTAKEALKELVGRMSEGEANAWLDRISDRPDSAEGAPTPADALVPPDDDPFSALIRSWMADDPGAESETLTAIEAALAESGGVEFRLPPGWWGRTPRHRFARRRRASESAPELRRMAAGNPRGRRGHRHPRDR